MYAQADVAIEQMIARQGYEISASDQVAQFESRLPHAHAETFGLVAPGDGAAVIVAEHDYRTPLQRGVESALAAHKEIIAVGQSCHFCLSVMNPSARSMYPSPAR